MNLVGLVGHTSCHYSLDEDNSTIKQIFGLELLFVFPIDSILVELFKVSIYSNSVISLNQTKPVMELKFNTYYFLPASTSLRMVIS